MRTPSRIENNFNFSFLYQSPIYLRLIGDGDFNPENMVGYEAGWRGHVSKTVLIGLSAYYNDYDDLLSVENRAPFVETTPTPVHLVLPLYLRNGIEGYTKGIEVGGFWQPSKVWELRGSYSYLHLVVHDAPGSDDASSVKQEEGDSPAHMVVVRSSFHLPKRLQFDLNYRYVSKLPDQGVGAYSTANMRFSWRRRDWEFAVVGQNLLQPYHYEYGGDPGGLVGIRRSVYGQVTFTTGGR